nr:protein FAM53A-like [Ciona intestinalis]|eukprot:XP_002122240.2 protein FAM53A-like [Ciona intestinalis]
MSAMVTQLSYSINEKLHLDDSTFPSIPQQQHHRPESSVPTAKPSTSKNLKFAQKEHGQWSPPVSNVSPSHDGTSTSSNNAEKYFQGSGTSVVGVALPRHKPQRSIVFSTRSIKPVALVKTQLSNHEETTIHDLRSTSYRETRKSFSAAQYNRLEKWSVPKPPQPTLNETVADNTDCSKPNTSANQLDKFPSIVGKSCILHSPVKSSQVLADNPPNKRHCRSVSEPDEMLDKFSPNSSPIFSSWNPSSQSSRVWVPIRKLGNRRAYSANNSRSLGDCSRSLDCASLCSESSTTQDSLLTPPSSPVPRPASVTVIKRGGAWTFLSSQHSLSEHSSFSPLSSPSCNISSPLSSRSAHGITSSSLSATKRSLSFSEDFEYRASIQYTPTSTPELERRFDGFNSSRKGGLLRCQSHPSDLNMKKKGRRRLTSRLSHRPTLDFAKMKQTSINRRKSRETRCCANTKDGNKLIQNKDVSPIEPVFPSSLVVHDAPRKGKLVEPVMSRYSPPIMFSIGCTRVPNSNPTKEDTSYIDEVVAEQDDVIMETRVASFERDCADLNVDAIENEEFSD